MKKLLFSALSLLSMLFAVQAQPVLSEFFLCSSNSEVRSGETFQLVLGLNLPAGVEDPNITGRLPLQLGTNQAEVEVIADELRRVLDLEVTASYGGENDGSCYSDFQYGGTVRLSVHGTVTSTVSVQLQLTVRSRIGSIYQCTVNPHFALRSANAITEDGERVLWSNFTCVTIRAENDWRIRKSLSGFIGVNAVRYRVEIDRVNNGIEGYFDLQDVFIEDIAEPNALITGIQAGTLNPNILNQNGNELLCAIDELRVCNYANGRSRYFFVDVSYPCSDFTAPQEVENCISLRGKSPEDCNRPSLGRSRQFIPSYTTGENIYCASGCPLRVFTLLPNPFCSSCPPRFVSHWPVTDTELVQQQHCVNTLLPEVYTVSALLSKRLATGRNEAPGCESFYRININNNGPITLNELVLLDDFPDDLELTGPPTCWASSPGLCTGITYRYLCNNTWTDQRCDRPSQIEIVFPGEYAGLLPGEWITFEVPFYIPLDLTAGQELSDVDLTTCANLGNATLLNFNGEFDFQVDGCDPVSSFTAESVCASEPISIEGYCAVPDIRKRVLNGTTFSQGQIVEYELCISNQGGAELVAELTDNIHPDLEFLGVNNVTLSSQDNSQYACISDNTGSGTFQSDNSSIGLSGTINLPANCVNNRYSNLIIRYQTRVRQGVSFGVKTNTVQLRPPTGVQCWAEKRSSASIAVAQVSAAVLTKCVRTDLADDWVCGNSPAAANPGSTVQFRLTFQNTGTTPLNHIQIADWLPNTSWPNQCLLSGEAMNSEFDLNLITYEAYGPTGNPLNAGLSWFDALPTDVRQLLLPEACGGINLSGTASPTPLAVFDFGSTTLSPGEQITVIITTQVPTTAAVGMQACNCAARAACTGNLALPAADANTVCVEVVAFQPNCCLNLNSSLRLDTVTYRTTANEGVIEMLPSFTLTVSPYPVQEVRISLTDFELNYNPADACKACVERYIYLGNFALESGALPEFVGALPLLTPMQGNRELIYSGTPVQLTNIPLSLPIYLPGLEAIPCCNLTGEICLKFTIKDVNCNYCEELLCIPLDYTFPE
ncbi:MAG: hypothetical protein AAFR36_28130 [Bacteroidota bacterium]